MLRFDCSHQYGSGFQLDFKFESDARVTAVCGPSGSGKTTVLALIAGLLKPKRGRIELDDLVLTDIAGGVFQKPENRNVGLLFQDHCLFPHLDVRSNLAYGRKRQSNQSQNEFNEANVIETLELEEILDRYPSAISGGQLQRVALGRAILACPKLLLLDEPLTAVEPELRDRITDFIENAINRFKIPTILVSHNEALVDRLADCRIDLGRINLG